MSSTYLSHSLDVRVEDHGALENDELIEERTAMSLGEICTLTSLCLRSAYFHFKDDFYEQCDGAAMGSPLLPVVAKHYVEAFEKRALWSSTLSPKRWWRYVDNIFVVWPHGRIFLNMFYAHLNAQHPFIQLTKKEESGGKIPFLHVVVEWRGTSVITSIYHKPTHTDRYTLHLITIAENS